MAIPQQEVMVNFSLLLTEKKVWPHYSSLPVYHRERILETSTLSCNEEEEEITKPPKR